MGFWDKILGKDNEKKDKPENQPLADDNKISEKEPKSYSFKKSAEDKAFEEDLEKSIRAYDGANTEKAVGKKSIVVEGKPLTPGVQKPAVGIGEDLLKPVEVKPVSSSDKKTVGTPGTFMNKPINKPVAKTYYKPLEEKRLAIFLIEDSAKTAEQKDSILKLIKSLVLLPDTSRKKKKDLIDLVYVINYGTTINKGKILKVSPDLDVEYSISNDSGNDVCFYDALVELEDFFSKVYNITKENENHRIKIKDVEIIGIGTCRDTCSKTSKEIGIDSFCKIANKPNVVTKYLCITEETFIDAAEIGFRSIGAICRKY